MAALLSLRNLKVQFETPTGTITAVRGVDLDLAAGEALGIVGESGSGKSQIANAIMGLIAANGSAEGKALFAGDDLLTLPRRQLDQICGKAIGMIFQEPMTSLDPLTTIGHQMALPLLRHSGLSRTAARAEARRLLDLVRIPDAGARLDTYAHELSGGQRQRVMIAMAIANRPRLLIADEPTTALDVTVQGEIITLIEDLRRQTGMAVLFISHDLNLVRRFADRVAVMRDGAVVEEGPTDQLFAMPQMDYTRALIAAEPEGRKSPPPAGADVLIGAQSLSVAFQRPRRLFRPRPAPFLAVRDVTLAVKAGETLGLVGESGSGKSTLGRALFRLVGTSGDITFAGQRIDQMSRAALKPLRRDMQMVFQDPFGSLSPRMMVGDIVTEGLRVHEPGLSAAERDRRAAMSLSDVQIDPAHRFRFPHEFSGGQRQRIAIARALILRPKLVLLDEPTSALDRTVQKDIVGLLRAIQQRDGLTYLFISHDLAVVRALADRIAVMKDGRIVELGPAEEIVTSPRTDYGQSLMRAAFPVVA